MTIKEVENRTGLARANIRYYEDQGFFSAARGANGYRDYSEEDINTLLKVKLLRQLGFSLEEIHALQRGEQSLSTALEQREAGLDAERQALDRAAWLCREIRRDGADFYTLDARRYLERMVPAETVIQRDQDPVRIFPWRRYFARTLDFQLYITLLTLILQLAARANVVRLNQNTGISFLLKFAALAILAGAETVMLHLWGTTPGKALLGLKILREDGSKLSLDAAGRRTVYVVLFYGFAQVLLSSGVVLFVFPGLMMLVWACWQVYHERELFWEPYGQLYLDGSTRAASFWEKRSSFVRAAGWLAAFAACIGLMVGGHFFAARPPHTEKVLTVEQFAENYNQYMNFTYGAENLSRRLTPDGTFEERPSQNNAVVIYAFGEPPVPEEYFCFDQEDGNLHKVVLTRKYEGRAPLAENDVYGVDIPYGEIYAAMRSCLWSRLGAKGIDSAYHALAEAHGNYHTSLDGVQIDSEMRFSGYSSFGENALFAEAGAQQSYFVQFTMELTD